MPTNSYLSKEQMIRKIFTLVFTVAILAIPAMAGEGHDLAKKKEITQFEGKLVCLSCDLKMTEGAQAACKEFGHHHALKTGDGKYISFLENKFSRDLIDGEKYQNQDMKVSGVYFAGANQLDVQKFEVGGKTKSWCDHCSSMDGCMSKGGM